MSFPCFLALKYMKPKRSVASVITLVSVLGVMLGVAVVIIVRSVMTGFGDIWEEKILDFKPHVSLVPVEGNVIHGEEALADAIRRLPGVTCVTPEIDTRVLLSHKGRVLAPIILGVDGDEFTRAYRIGDPRAGSFDLEGDTIVLGTGAARTLGVWVGDEVTVYSPKTLVAKDEVFLPVKWKVGGIFSCGQHEYDSGYVVASLPNVRDLMGMEKGVFAIHVKTDCATDNAKFDKLVEALRHPPTSNLQPSTSPSAYWIPEVRTGTGLRLAARNFERSFYNGTVIDGFRLLKRSALERIGGYDENLIACEDWDLDRRLLASGAQGALLASHLFHNEARQSLATLLRKKAYYSTSVDRYREKWHNDEICRRQFGIGYRFFGVFFANGGWKRLLRHPLLAGVMYFERSLVAFTYLTHRNGVGDVADRRKIMETASCR